jgi:ABC-type branched-subunit amino acid transport system ATPase component
MAPEQTVLAAQVAVPAAPSPASAPAPAANAIPAAARAEPALEVAIDVRRGSVTVVRGAQLTLAAGGALGVVGRNGVGKSTLLGGIVGLLPTSGRLRALQSEIARWPAHRRAVHGLALVPQGRRLFADLTVAENLRTAEVSRRGDGPDFDVFALFPKLRELLHRRAGLLSGGEQQQVAIARALKRRPQLLLLDEPTEGLAPSIVGQVTDALARLRAGGLALLIAEQRLDVVAELCDEVAVMRGGEIVAQGPAASTDIRERLLAL